MRGDSEVREVQLGRPTKDAERKKSRRGESNDLVAKLGSSELIIPSSSFCISSVTLYPSPFALDLFICVAASSGH